MGLFDSPVKAYVRKLLHELQQEIATVEREQDLVSAKVLRIIGRVMQRVFLTEGA